MKAKKVYVKVFFLKILALLTVSVQEQFTLESGTNVGVSLSIFEKKKTNKKKKKNDRNALMDVKMN